MTNRNETHTVRKIEAEGVVRAVEIDDDGGGAFKLLLDNGDTLTAPFTRQQDVMVTNALHLRHTLRLSVAGPAEFDANGKPRRILHLERCEPTTKLARELEARVSASEEGQDREENSSKSTGSSILKMFEEIHKSAPEGVWDDVPTDLAKNWHDYKYGRKGRKAGKQ